VIFSPQLFKRFLRIAFMFFIGCFLFVAAPTSAVDAHTEARIAQRLHGARTGRTTVIATTSPLVLDRADRVALIEDGRVVAEGTHRELLRSTPAYRLVVTRGEDE